MLCLRCACAVRNVGYFGPVFPDGQVDCGDYCVPTHRTAQVLTPSQKSDNELKQTIFHTESAKLLFESAVFASWTYATPVVGGFQGGHRKVTYNCALCTHCAELPPLASGGAFRNAMPVGAGGHPARSCNFDPAESKTVITATEISQQAGISLLYEAPQGPTIVLHPCHGLWLTAPKNMAIQQAFILEKCAKKQ